MLFVITVLTVTVAMVSALAAFSGTLVAQAEGMTGTVVVRR